MSKEKKVRLWMAILGVFGTSMSMGFLRVSLFGSSPFQCGLEGITNVIPIGYGTFYVIVSAGILLVMLKFGRRYIGIATFVNLVFFGYGVEFTQFVMLSIVPSPSLAFRIGCLVAGVVCITFFAAMYIVADLGTAPYDGVALMMADYKMGKFRYCRIFTDVTCVVIGYVLGAIVGVGTVITAFFIGPLIDLYRTYIFVPFLARHQD